MPIKIAINGFGRIGRNVLRALYESKYQSKISVVAINEIADSESMLYLLKYDSIHGKFNENVILEKKNLLSINNRKIQIFHESKLENLPWKKLGIDIVLECTGVYGTKAHGIAHLNSGAKKVLFSQLGNPDLNKIIVHGVNEKTIKNSDLLISNASCTTNCIAPIINILDKKLNIKHGMITVIHSAMNDQQIIDSYHQNDLRKSRASMQSIIPVDTQLTSGITRIFPKFKNKFHAISVRVPVINVTAIDLNLIVKSHVTSSEINKILKNETKKSLCKIVDYTELPLVSIDFNHETHSAIVDGTQTKVINNNFVKILSWCDNEWGFSNRMLDTILIMGDF